MTETDKLQKIKRKVERELRIFLLQKKTAASKLDKNFGDFVGRLADYATGGGKRIRAILLVVVYQALGGKLAGDIHKFGAALELSHAAALIHDDFIDQDKMRRGNKTIHYYYEQKTAKIGREMAFARGKSLAILGGDLLACYANELALATAFPESSKVAAMNYYFIKGYQMGLGEMMDIHFTRREISEKQIDQLNYLKTSTYTTEGPMVMGGILAGADRVKLSLLRRAGRALGSAFQIKDDLLGMVDESNVIGKDSGSDLREGKTNKVVKAVLSTSPPREKKIIKDYLAGSKKFPARLVQTLIKKNIKQGEIDSMLEKDLTKAKKAISETKIAKEYLQELNALAQYLIYRKK